MAKTSKKRGPGRPVDENGAHSQWLQVRIDDGLDALIEATVKRLRAEGAKVTRSSVVREVLRSGLTSPESVSAAAGTLQEIQRTSERVVRQILGDVFKELPGQVPEYIERELQQST